MEEIKQRENRMKKPLQNKPKDWFDKIHATKPMQHEIFSLY